MTTHADGNTSRRWIVFTMTLAGLGCPQSKPDPTSVTPVARAPAQAPASRPSPPSRPAASKPAAGTAVPAASGSSSGSAGNAKTAALGAMAVDVVARAQDIDPSKVVVDAIDAVEWPDSSLGCPQPGQFYMQVMTPGHKIKLHVGDSVYFVHAANGRGVLCPSDASAGEQE